jgi:hypothetical protein
MGQSATIQTDKGPVTVYSAEYVAELQAQVHRLQDALCDVSAALHDERCCAPCATVAGVIACAPAVLKETPAQSVAHIEAAVLRKWAVRFGKEAHPSYGATYGGGHYVALTNVSRMLHEECNALGRNASTPGEQL